MLERVVESPPAGARREDNHPCVTWLGGLGVPTASSSWPPCAALSFPEDGRTDTQHTSGPSWLGSSGLEDLPHHPPGGRRSAGSAARQQMGAVGRVHGPLDAGISTNSTLRE